MEKPIASKSVVSSNAPQNVSSSQYPSTISSSSSSVETAFIISSLFYKLKEFEGVFDSFLKGCGPHSLKPVQNSLSTNNFDFKLSNVDLSHPLLKYSFKRPLLLKSLKDNVKSDIFFVPEQSNKDNTCEILVGNVGTDQSLNENIVDTLDTFSFSNFNAPLFYDNPELSEDLSEPLDPIQSGFCEVRASSPLFFLFNEEVEKDEDTASQCTVFDDRLEYWNLSKASEKAEDQISNSIIPQNSSSSSIQRNLSFLNLSRDEDCHKVPELVPNLLSDDSSGYSTPCYIEQVEFYDGASSSTLPQLTIFEELTKMGVDWCRYCGTTEGINWRPGPWGKRTLCNKHGCDYKGYGFASKTPRLDLRSFINEPLENRKTPILQSYCHVCLTESSIESGQLISCKGCPISYHPSCLDRSESFYDPNQFYCSENCRDSLKKRRIVVELQKKRLPFMCSANSLPFKQISSKANCGSELSLDNHLEQYNPASKKRQIHIENDNLPKKRKSSRSSRYPRESFFDDSLVADF
ncbi:hypothetical protein AYI68_g5911 [Smittium mucronatum]|uniref:Zinc finger PHD-type domain-containing protein n=1 Tax=Smittium mucronatum TaxID=133383 RepID=A0A1R0GSZ2_9FUNG|nr:hypothetical protein AYI68_g5911 [Smittium mucronatum]